MVFTRIRQWQRRALGAVCVLHFIAIGVVCFVAGCSPEADALPEKGAASATEEVGKSSAAADTKTTEGVTEGGVLPSSLVSPQVMLSENELGAGWISLFDGQTLFGWEANSETPWHVEDACVVADDGTPGLLVTTTEFEDYRFRCDVWLAEGGNSGLFLRTPLDPKNPASDCLELNLADDHKEFATGSLVGRTQAAESRQVAGDWHTVDVELNGPQIHVSIDGEMVLESSAPEYLQTQGRRIGLQSNGGEVKFRDIRIQPLGLTPMLGESEIEQWHPAPKGGEPAIEFTDGTVQLSGEGYLESDEQFDDFVLQFECRLNAKDVNSGLFFRAQPSTAEAPSNGYEMQLQNTIAEGNRTRPADYGDGFGTGAIFRRQAARYVNADDETWFTVTLIARGNHFSSWVNGLQVTDFVDERSANDNPREGRRDGAGHLSFQGHDAGTDASFRSIRIGKLKPMDPMP